MNLFDFSNIKSDLNPLGAALKPRTNGAFGVSQPTGGGMMPPTPQAQPLQETPLDLSKLDQAKVQSFISFAKQNWKTKEEAMTAFQKALNAGAFNKVEQKQKQTIGDIAIWAISSEADNLYDTLSGVAKKTGQSFVEWAKQIGKSAYQIKEGITEWKDIGRPIIEGLTRGVGWVIFSPVSGIAGQAIEWSIAPAVSQLTPQIAKDLTKEWFTNAQEWYNSQSEPVKQLIKDVWLTAEGALNLVGVKASPKIAEAALKGAANVTKAEIQWAKALVKWVSQWAKATGKTIGNVAKWAVKAPWKIAEGWISLATGISKEAQQAIKTAPKSYEMARKGLLTRESQAEKVASALKTRIDDLSAAGKEYQSVRKWAKVANTSEVEDIFIKRVWDLEMKNLPLNDRKALKNVSDYISERKWVLTDDDLLSLRHNIDTTIDWTEWVSTKWEWIILWIRSDLDKLAKERIKWLAKLDAKFAPEKKFIDEVRPLIFNKDGSLKDNYIQSIANITGKGKELKLDRLEKILPWIGDEARALKAYEEVGNILSAKTGSIGRQIAGTALGGASGGIPWAIAWYVATNPALYARWLELIGKLGSKTLKKTAPRPLKKSPIISKGKLQSAPKSVKLKKAPVTSK